MPAPDIIPSPRPRKSIDFAAIPDLPPALHRMAAAYLSYPETTAAHLLHLARECEEMAHEVDNANTAAAARALAAELRRRAPE